MPDVLPGPSKKFLPTLLKKCLKNICLLKRTKTNQKFRNKKDKKQPFINVYTGFLRHMLFFAFVFCAYKFFGYILK